MSENTKNKRKLIVTSALPYANSSLHLGHILEAVQTDIWVRFQNQNLNECLYFCADDTHGTPVMLKAQELGLSPEELIKNVKKDHIETYEKYGIDFTNFHSTHSDENKKIAQEIYMSAKENGLIKKKVINQLYDTKESMFLSDRFIKGTCPKCSAEDQYGDGCGVCNAAFSVEELINPISTLSNTKPILKESEHIFFDLPSKSEYIKKFLSEATLQEPIINKLHEWVGDGLKEWDISRDAPYFGFQIPNEPNKFFYVWLDAPIGYIASAMNWSVKKNIDISDLWFKNSEYEIHHFIGKDISYFHGLFWPALLESSKYKLPDGIHVHGFLTLNGEKMSKSKGTGIMASEFADICDPETLRYYFASKLNNKVEDLDLNLDDYVQKINSDLVGKYLNIASRSSSFISKNNNKLLTTSDSALLKDIEANKNIIIELYETRQYSKAVRLIMEMADEINKYINENTPWKKDTNDAAVIASVALNGFYYLSIYLKPIIPSITKSAFKFLNNPPSNFDCVGKELPHEINKYNPILNRLEKIELKKEEKMEDLNTINIDQFVDIDLRVAKIIKASHVEGADKLLKLELSVGDLGKRQVFAGIKSAYEPQDLDERLVILVSNLKPRQMKFGLSEGMVLASSDKKGGVFLVSPDEGAVEGQRVK
ncbi:methionine--tRNA ligase [Gammaproteobacteria bacterium]|jgi:methionyl-tRNA synthetase|nr:methionine--tRNA ligase [Gammaproteobacteria bacterium]MDC1124217.1 methionine--tRNA ligase [Gammaproteobacteria bacterium]MDC3302141.1 methionine--tRNA ligase [Gammaproteobacteria bacterium]